MPRGDAVLRRDCLVHLSFANIGRAIENIRRSRAGRLITTTFLELRENRDCEDGDWRALNLEFDPFDWGRPGFSWTKGTKTRPAGGATGV